MNQPNDLACPAYRQVKLFVWLWDVPVGGGATVVVPGVEHKCIVLRHIAARMWR